MNQARQIVALSLCYLMIILPVASGLRIDNVQVTGVTQTEATVSFTTDESAQASVEWGKSLSFGSLVPSAGGTQHQVRVSGLTPDSQHFFQVRAQTPAVSIIDNNGGNYYEIRSRPLQDTTAPVFFNFSFPEFTDQSTTVSWRTDDPSSSTVWVKETGNYQRIDDATPKTTHRLTIPTTLRREYTVIAMSCNSDNLCTNSTETKFSAGSDKTPPALELIIPAKVSENKVLVSGKTDHNAAISMVVNGQSLRSGSADAQGLFRVPNVPLNRLENTVQVIARDLAGNTQQKSAIVRIDAVPPRLQVTQFSPVLAQGEFRISARVNEPVNVTIFVNVQADTISPRRVTGVETLAIDPGRIVIGWKPVIDVDVLEYAVYRDNILVGTSKERSFVDETAPSATLVGYRVSAIDRSCNEGPRSDTFEVRIPTGPTSAPPQPLSLSCKRAVAEFSTDGDFVRTIPLQQGNNQVVLVVEDAAGNRVTYTNTTIFDNVPPRIEHLNIDDLSPTYIREVTIKGKASERVTVLVYFNEEKKPSKTDISNADGSFSIDVELPLGELITDARSVKAAAAGQGFLNKVRVEVVDVAGNKVSSREEELIYAQCGFGSVFSVYKTNPRPDTLNPRLIAEGLAQVGFNINLSYGGIGNFSFRGKPTVMVRHLSREEEGDWDKDVLVMNRWDLRRDTARGYVQITPNKPRFPDKTTRIDKLQNITAKRESDCPLVPPGFGCLRVPLMLEIVGVKTAERTAEGIEVSDQLGPQVEEILQRTCIDVQVAIDIPIDPDIIPNKFLQKSVEVMDEIVRGIDKIREPLEMIFKVTLYTCLAGFAVQFVLDIWETYACDISPAVNAFASSPENFWDPPIARSGLCNHPTYGYAEGTAQRNDCLDCQKAAQKNKDVSYYINWVCDRVYCPSAPSIQKYVRESPTVTELVAKNAPAVPSGAVFGASGGMAGAAAGGPKFFSGSSCQANYIEGSKVVATNYESVKKIYDTYRLHRNDKLTEDPFNRQAPNCNALHPAAGECCGYEYMEQFDSACVFFDELKQSKCGQAEVEGQADSDCKGFGKIFNSVAGFCESDGSAGGELITTDIELVRMPTNAKGKTYYLDVQQGTGTDNDPQAQGRTVKGGYEITHRRTGEDVQRDIRTITEQNALQMTADFSEFFRNENVNCDGFEQELERKEGRGKLVGRDNVNLGIVAKEACVKVKATFPNNREYVVDPTSSFLRSLQCGCIAGVNSYLSLYRNVIGAVSNCFKSILVTGDGTEGQCQAMLSAYICDLVYEVISCAVQYTDFTTSREGRGKPFESIGNVLKTVTSAGQKTQQRITNRYGASSMFKAMFGERKLVHAICLFAFTGTWSLDISSMLESGIPPVPIDSTALVYPVERRFVSFDLASRPSGLAVWNYHIGMSVAAGADIAHRMFLVCSADFSCDSTEGFPNKQCDCLRSGEKRMPVPLRSSQIKAGELYTEEIFINVPGPTSPEGNVRFDKVVYEYDYRDSTDRDQRKSINQKINQVGGDPPVFCQMDILTSTYRCTLDIGQERFARFSGDPRVVYTSEGDSYKQFKLDERVAFSVPIIARVDEACNSPPCKDTKYLIYTIKAGGAIVKSGNELVGTNDITINDPRRQGIQREAGRPNAPKPEEMIQFNGEKTIMVEPFIVTNEIFSGTRTQTLTVTPTQYDSDFSVGGQMPSDDITLYVFSDRVHAYKVAPDQVGTQIPQNVTPSLGQQSAFVDGLRVGLPNSARLTEIFRQIGPTNYLIVHISSRRSATSLCDQFKDKPLKLTATFELRDAEQVGGNFFGPSSTIATDPEGIQQKRTTYVDIVCSDQFVETDEARFAATDRPCDKGQIARGNCHCYATDPEVQRAITQRTTPNCGPTGAQGDYCNPTGQCVQTNRCQKNTILSDQDYECNCFRNDTALIAHISNPQALKNCGLNLTDSSTPPKKLGNYCADDGKCLMAINDLIVFELNQTNQPVMDAGNAAVFPITNDIAWLPAGQHFRLTAIVHEDVLNLSADRALNMVLLTGARTPGVRIYNSDPQIAQQATTYTFILTDHQGDVFEEEVDIELS